MNQQEAEHDLIAQAVDGQPAALERLLLRHYDRLAAHITARLPATLRGATDVEEVLQETFVQVWRHIRRFEPRGGDAFFYWMATIAEHRLLDKIKAHRAGKRGGDRARVEAAFQTASGSLAALLDLVAAADSTPSQSAARHEAEQILLEALNGLREDYREAMRLRYLEGLPVAEVAARMQRTERAVHMLCHRGKKLLREALGQASRYLDSRL